MSEYCSGHHVKWYWNVGVCLGFGQGFGISDCGGSARKAELGTVCAGVNPPAVSAGGPRPKGVTAMFALPQSSCPAQLGTLDRNALPAHVSFDHGALGQQHSNLYAGSCLMAQD